MSTALVPDPAASPRCQSTRSRAIGISRAAAYNAREDRRDPLDPDRPPHRRPHRSRTPHAAARRRARRCLMTNTTARR